MKVLVLGAGGMLGHKVVQILSERYEVIGTVRQPAQLYERYVPVKRALLIGGVDVIDFEGIKQVFSQVQPDFVINCVGVIKQIAAASDPVTAISLNSLFPHRLASLCQALGARLIHISTDCVFSGKQGMYKESDVSDATDLYGRSKFLGEVSGPGCLTLRTSIIGRELESQNGLIEWFLQKGREEVKGFRKAIYSGLTTIEFAQVLQLVIEAQKELTGVYHVSSDPISKYDLLLLVKKALNLPVRIVPVDIPAIDRSLDSTRFRQEMDYNPPSWQSMVQALAADQTPYEVWHSQK